MQYMSENVQVGLNCAKKHTKALFESKKSQKNISGNITQHLWADKKKQTEKSMQLFD